MAIANNIGNLISEVEKQFKESCEQLKEFEYLPEVESFLSRRRRDLLKFKNLTAGYNSLTSVITVEIDLRENPLCLSNNYRLICLKGSEYFKVPKKVREIVEKEKYRLNELLCKRSKPSCLNFDKDFCIPDELSTEILDKLYE